MGQKKILIIDGHNYLFRSYVIPFKFSSEKGTSLHVVTTFLGLIRRSIKAIPDFNNNDSLVVIFDSQTTNSNVSISSEYKANRKQDYSQDTDSPFRHLGYIKCVLDYLGITNLELSNIEADDVIASIATQFIEANKKGLVYIASRDTDFYQLISKSTKLVILKQKKPI